MRLQDWREGPAPRFIRLRDAPSYLGMEWIDERGLTVGFPVKDTTLK
jgi:hypothetical protein